MGKGTIQQQLSKAKVVLHQDYSSKVKPADVYFLRLAHKELDTPVAVKMTLPAGDYIVIAQGFIGGGMEGGIFAFSLSYRHGSKTVSDEVVLKLEPYAPPYNALLSCGVTADSPNSVQFSFLAAEGMTAGVMAVKITALRVGSLKIVTN